MVLQIEKQYKANKGKRPKKKTTKKKPGGKDEKPSGNKVAPENGETKKKKVKAKAKTKTTGDGEKKPVKKVKKKK